MSKMRVRHLVAAVLAAAAALLTSPVQGCTTIMVGKGATTDGSLIAARNVDDENATVTQNLFFQPPQPQAVPFRSNVNSFMIELAPNGLASLSFPKDYGQPLYRGYNASFQESGFNSAGISISATETIYNSDAALAADPYVQDSGLIEDVLMTLLLPRATSARAGAALLGSLVEAVGAGEGFGVLFADAAESWYLETGSGHHWLAQRIPDDAVFVSANQGRFQSPDLSDGRSVMHSPGIAEFAVANGLNQPGRFDFQAFIQDGPSFVNYDYNRMCALLTLYTDMTNGSCWAQAPRYPVFPKPARKLAARDVMAGLRNHYQGTANDPYGQQEPSATGRPVAVLRTSLSHVTVHRPAGLPDGLSVINYVAMSMPLLSPYVPIYKGLAGQALPPQLTNAGFNTPDATSLYWKARRLQALVFKDFPLLQKNATAAISAFEEEVEERLRPDMEARYRQLAAQGKHAAADQLLAGWTERVVLLACEALEGATAEAARALGLPAVPGDAKLLQMLNAAAEKYAYHQGG